MGWLHSATESTENNEGVRFGSKSRNCGDRNPSNHHFDPLFRAARPLWTRKV